MPGGIGPVSATTQAACARGDREIAAPASSNEIFYNLDGRRVYFDSRLGDLYFVEARPDLAARTILTSLAGMSCSPVIEQLHLDTHKCFSGARRIRLDRAQAAAVLVALRLAGVRATVR